MRNRILPIFILAALAGCAKESAPVESHYGEVKNIRFTASNEEDIKTNLSTLPTINWEESDQIMVYAGESSSIFSVEEGSIKGNKANFEGMIGEASQYAAVYPASAAGTLTGSSVEITMPRVQTIVEGSDVDPDALLSVAQSSTTSLGFKNVFALVKVTLTGTDVCALVVESKNGEMIAGTASVNTATAAVESVSEGCSYVIAQPGSGNFAAGTYYIPILPATLEGGIRVCVRKAGCLEASAGTDAEVVLLRNCGINCGNVDELVASKNFDLVVRSRADFDSLVSGGGQLAADGATVYVGNDIDMGEINGGVAFNGTLDGRGNCLYNLKVSGGLTTGLISTVSGTTTIRDIKAGTADGSSYDGTSSISASGESGETVCAGLVGTVVDGASITMSNVETFVPATITGAAKGYLGGVIGNCTGACTLTDVSNHSAINVKSTGAIFAAGVVGNLDYGGTVTWTRVKNSGSVDCNAETTGSTYLGGLLGRGLKASQIVNMNYCENSGNITNNKGAGTVYVAGMVGNIGTGSTPKVTGKINFSNCSNSGRVENCVAKGMRLSGFVASVYGVMTATDCENSGAVIADKGTSATDIGGFIGKNTGTADGAFTRCTNSGSIMIYGATSTSAALSCGGIIGNSTGHTFTDCVNTGNIIVNNGSGKVASIWAGGIIGNVAGTTTVTRGSSNCTVSASSATTKCCGQLVGNAATLKATNAGIGGSVNGSAITSANWTSNIFGKATTSTGVITDGGSTSCYFIGGSEDTSVSIKVGNFNLWSPEARQQDLTDGKTTAQRLWPAAVDGIAQAINDMDCDIIGFNELRASSWGDDTDGSSKMTNKVDALNDGAYTWNIKFDNNISGSFCNGFAYKTAKFDLLEGPTCLFYDTANKTQSATKVNSSRTIVFAKFREKSSGKEFWFASTHLELNSPSCEKTAECCVNWAETLVNHELPCIIVGDMNSASVSTSPEAYRIQTSYWTDAYDYLRRNGLLDTDSFSKPASRPGSSKTGTGTTSENSSLTSEANRYDHIMVDLCTPVSYSTNRGMYEVESTGYWYSDHFPITAIINL